MTMAARISHPFLLLCAITVLSSTQCIFFVLVGTLRIDGSHAETNSVGGNDTDTAQNNETSLAIDALNQIQVLKAEMEEMETTMEQLEETMARVRAKLSAAKSRLQESERALNGTFTSALPQEQEQDNTIKTQESKEEIGQSDDYCKTEGSLNEIVFKMANHSSPVDSFSYNKTKRILEEVSSFHINLGNPIFDDVAVNIATMLKGFGLRQETTSIDREDVIRVERIHLGHQQQDEKCTESPRIIIQTEQLHALGKWYLHLFRDCHTSQNCVLWDFSDYNYEWAKQHGVADSVMLLPLMIQSRLVRGREEEAAAMVPLPSRSHDVVFFAYMLQRRTLLKQEILDSRQHWNMIFEDNNQVDAMVAAYQNAKVCLVVHAYDAQSGGEYHRLSEFGILGCVPVMEAFADTIAVNDYGKCGGVVFAPYELLIGTVDRVLREINASQRDHAQYVEWWKRGIEWQNVLVKLFR